MSSTHRINPPAQHQPEDRLLAATALLDFHHPDVQRLVRRGGWTDLPEKERIGAVYDFVRNEIPFGYNSADALPASAVLSDGFGQCNTKTILLMALLRASGLPCRFHGATIDKRLQHGVMTGVMYRAAPVDILHSWAEVRFAGRWVSLEGVILDDAYLAGVRARTGTTGAFLGLAVGTEDLANPSVTWTGADTPSSRRDSATTTAPTTTPTTSTEITAGTCATSEVCSTGSGCVGP